MSLLSLQTNTIIVLRV